MFRRTSLILASIIVLALTLWAIAALYFDFPAASCAFR